MVLPANIELSTLLIGTTMYILVYQAHGSTRIVYIHSVCEAERTNIEDQRSSSWTHHRTIETVRKVNILSWHGIELTGTNTLMTIPCWCSNSCGKVDSEAYLKRRHVPTWIAYNPLLPQAHAFSAGRGLRWIKRGIAWNRSNTWLSRREFSLHRNIPLKRGQTHRPQVCLILQTAWFSISGMCLTYYLFSALLLYRRPSVRGCFLNVSLFV